MLQRLLHVDETVAKSLFDQLLQEGAISAHANAYGIHEATNPIFPDAHLSGENIKKTISDEKSAVKFHDFREQYALRPQSADENGDTVYSLVRVDLQGLAA